MCPCTSVIAVTSRAEPEASAMPMWKPTSARRYSSKHAAADVLAQRGTLGDERAARPSAQRYEVAALHERGQRLAQRRPGDAEQIGEVALRRQPAARGKEPQPDSRP